MIALRQLLFAAIVGSEPALADDPALAEATAAFEAERWAEAAEAFARAYERDPQPKYLYGRAQALRFDGDCETAIDVYREFIAASESDEANAYARDAITLCEDALAERPPDVREPPPPVVVDTPPAPTPERERASPWFRDRLGHGLFWPGVALGVTGGVLLGVAYDRAAHADEAPSERGYLDALDSASALRVSGIAALAVGGALIVAGTIRFAVVAHRGRRRATAASLLVVRF